MKQRHALPTIALICTIALLATIPTLQATSAFIDLVNPGENTATNTQNVTFEYYPSLDGLQNCTLSLDTTTFVDNNVTNNAFNQFTVTNINAGTYSWRVSCTNGVDTEHSVIRELTIDRTNPTLNLLYPVNGETATLAQATIFVEDDASTNLSCQASIDGDLAASFTATSGETSTQTLDLESGTYDLAVKCTDDAGNNALVTRAFTLALPLPTLFLNLTTDKSTYDLGDLVSLTINSVDGATLNLDICPDEDGFVQCYTPLVDDEYPQTLTLPYTNTTGDHLVTAVATLGNQTESTTLTYTVRNSMSVTIDADDTPRLDNPITLRANVFGALGNVSYDWDLSNDSTMHTPEVTMTYTKPGSYDEQVTVTDAYGNTASKTYTVTIDPEYLLTITVKEATSGTPIPGVNLQIQEKGGDENSYMATSDSDGKAFFSLKPERYNLFASKDGYSYYIEELTLSESGDRTILLNANDNSKPVVTITNPVNGTSTTLPASIAFNVQDENTVTCALAYARAGDAWMQEAETMQVNETGTFTLANLEQKTYSYMIECTDESGNRGESETRTLTITEGTSKGAETTSKYVLSDDPLAVIDDSYAAYDSFNEEERAVADIIGWEKLIKLLKKSLSRSERDLNSIQFRNDLDADGKAREEQRLRDSIAESQANVPVNVVIKEVTEESSMPEPTHLALVAATLIREKGYAVDEETLTEYIARTQQDFSYQTTYYRATIQYANGDEVPLSIVQQSIQYKAGMATTKSPDGNGENVQRDGDIIGFNAGGLNGSYTIYESFPENVATTRGDIITTIEHDVLHETPLGIAFAPEHTITYYTKQDVAIDDLKGITTTLLKEPSSEELKAITGHATIFSNMTKVNWKWSIILTLALTLLVLLYRYGSDLLSHVKYFLYAESRKKPVHAIRVLVNDGLAQLEAGNVDHAILRYKEAKLSYERLGTFACNEAYDDVKTLGEALDHYYFNLLVERLNDALHQGDHRGALEDFARLEGTFHCLDREEQRRVEDVLIHFASLLNVNDGLVEGLVQRRAAKVQQGVNA